MFVKVFKQIHDSSIARDHMLRLVFMDFLILSDRDGVVNMTADAIARRTNVPLETVQSAIEQLMAPDPESNSPDLDGRRLAPLTDEKPWGWRIVNFEKYRNIRNSDELRAQTRERVKRFREKNKLPEDVPSTTRTSFVKPTLDELKLLMAKTGLADEEAEKFLNHYEANGWKVGRNKMVSVPAAVGNWARNHREKIFQPAGSRPANRYVQPNI